MNIEKLIREKQGTILDVRSEAEFSGGHVKGSLNIPLHELPSRMEEVKSLNEPLILCCASGGRSGQAHLYLKQLGIDCHNAGSWLNVEYVISQTV
jgi:phage shock protein E